MANPPLDLSRPLELDDGTPVEVQTIRPGGYFTALTQRYMRNGDYCPSVWNFEPDGSWRGGSRKTYHYIRNVGPAEPEEYEEWFVA